MDAETVSVRHEVNEMVKWAENQRRGSLERISKPRIRLHPFCRDIWICNIQSDKKDVAMVGYSPLEAYQRWALYRYASRQPIPGVI